MNDEFLEDLAIETLDSLAEVLSRPESSQEEKAGIVRALKKWLCLKIPVNSVP